MEILLQRGILDIIKFFLLKNVLVTNVHEALLEAAKPYSSDVTKYLVDEFGITDVQEAFMIAIQNRCKWNVGFFIESGRVTLTEDMLEIVGGEYRHRLETKKIS